MLAPLLCFRNEGWVKRFLFPVCLGIALCFSGCLSEVIGSTTPPPGVALALEAEDFRLLEADVVADPRAFGGQAVKIRSIHSFCSADFFLQPGRYVVRIRIKAFDTAHDELYLTIGSMTIAVRPKHTGVYEYCPQRIEFTVTNQGQGFVQFATFPSGRPVSEIGMLVDTIEFWKAEDLPEDNELATDD